MKQKQKQPDKATYLYFSPDCLINADFEVETLNPLELIVFYEALEKYSLEHSDEKEIGLFEITRDEITHQLILMLRGN